MQSIKVNFANSAGENLAGILDSPASPPRAYALFAHCFTCSKNLKAATNISRAMTDAGIAVLRFDFTGLGQSDGEFADTSFSSNVDDLLAASRWLTEEHRAPEILLGHSLGGTAVLQAAARVPSAIAVATIGSPSDPAHVSHMFHASESELREKGSAEVLLGGRPFLVKEQFLDDLKQHDLPTAVTGLRKALLVMHAPLDDIVDIQNASALFAAAKHPKSFISLDKADHLMSAEADSLYAGQVLAAWGSALSTGGGCRERRLAARRARPGCGEDVYRRLSYRGCRRQAPVRCRRAPRCRRHRPRSDALRLPLGRTGDVHDDDPEDVCQL